jgi:Arc/MetJ-type ribon-helix-helix transcriptional regulator
MLEYGDEAKLRQLVERYSEFINFPISLWTTKEVEKEVPVEEEEAEAEAEADEKPSEDVEDEGTDGQMQTCMCRQRPRRRQTRSLRGRRERRHGRTARSPYAQMQHACMDRGQAPPRGVEDKAMGKSSVAPVTDGWTWRSAVHVDRCSWHALQRRATRAN